VRPGIAAGAAAALTLLIVACGGASNSSAKRTHTSSSPPAAPIARAAAGANWTTFGGANSRASIAPGAPAHPRLRRRFARSLDGHVYAQPLIANGRIYVATENNTIYAYTTGGKLVWKRHLGTPVPQSDLPCGNIDPTGITGTPVITAGRIYAVAFLRNGHKHVLYGLRLSNGRIAVRANVSVANATAHQERGALIATQGRVYVPYGGLFGDCGPYHGAVVSVTTAGRARIGFRDPAAMAGIWAPAGISQQGSSLLVSTGNGGSGLRGWENAVIRLSLGLKRKAYWAPTNWQDLSNGDVDESSEAPLPVSGGRVFQIGKDGVGYLLPDGLGGIGGQIARMSVCEGGAFGADAVRGDLIVTECGGNLYGLRLSGDRLTRAWQSGSDGMVPVFAGDSVFAIDRGGTLVQLRASNGSRIDSTQVGDQATSFPAPAAAGSTLVAPAGRGIVVFGL
jgi:outer membrane protein assembly factor BamB